MAQTKRKRRTKHRGTAAGTIEARGRTGRPPTADEKQEAAARTDAREQAAEHAADLERRRSTRAALASAFMFVFLLLLGPRHRIESAALIFARVRARCSTSRAATTSSCYLYRRRHAQEGRPSQMIDVRMFTVGPVQENCFIVRAQGRRDRA